MVVATMPDSTTGGSDSQPTTVEEPSGPVPHLGCFIDDLVKGREDIVCELDLCDRCGAGCRGSNSKPDDALFGERGVEDAAGAEARGEACGAAEDAAERDVLSEDQGAEKSGGGGGRLSRYFIEGWGLLFSRTSVREREREKEETRGGGVFSFL